MTPREAYEQLAAHSKKTTTFGSIGSVLGWDQRTYMPAGGSKHRSEQLSLLAGMAHGMHTDPRIGEWLAAAEGSDLAKDPESVECVNLREWRRGYDKATKVPQALVEALSKATSQAYDAWVQARKDNSFAAFRPHLELVVKLVREKADALGWKASRYDALADLYEPDATAAGIRAVFEPLRKELAELVARLSETGKKPDPSVMDNDYPVAAQEALCVEGAKDIGFDFACGRLDITTHPFCSGFGPGDVRMTTRYHPRHFSHGFFGTLHEAGHGLYNQGLPQEHYGTPMGASVSLGIHESQSRMWENFVGRSRAFWRFFLPKAQKAFPGAMGGKSADDVYFAINESQRDFIRVEADESTYNLHIMLRFEMELKLIDGGLAVSDAPGAWNETFKKLLGLDVPDDANGILQDVHWSGGGFGYFPTYCMGNLFAAQFFEQARADVGDLDAQFAKGEFHPLLDWLRKNIHAQGKRYRSAKLCEKITGKPLSHAPLMRHLKGKLEPLYGLD